MFILGLGTPLVAVVHIGSLAFYALQSQGWIASVGLDKTTSPNKPCLHLHILQTRKEHVSWLWRLHHHISLRIWQSHLPYPNSGISQSTHTHHPPSALSPASPPWPSSSAQPLDASWVVPHALVAWPEGTGKRRLVRERWEAPVLQILSPILPTMEIQCFILPLLNVKHALPSHTP